MIPLRSTLIFALCVLFAATALAQRQKSPPVYSPEHFKSMGATEEVAICAAHAARSVKTPSPFHFFIFEGDWLTTTKLEAWDAPFKLGDSKRVAQLVSFTAGAQAKIDNQPHRVQIKCGLNGSKVDGFSFKDLGAIK